MTAKKDLRVIFAKTGRPSVGHRFVKAIARANKPATITSPPPESRSEETRADVQVSFMGNVGTLQSQRQPQVPFTGNTRNTGAIATHTQAPLLGGPQMQMQPPMFPYGFMPGQSFNEQFFNTLIDQRIKQMDVSSSKTR